MANSKWSEAIEEANRESGGFIAFVKAELIQAVPMKGVGIVPFDPTDPAHTGLAARKAARITCETRQTSFARTMFLVSDEFRMFHESVQALGLTMDDVEAGVLARIVSRPLVRANGQPVTYIGRDGAEKIKTAWTLVELIEPDDDPMTSPSPNTPQPHYPPPANANEQAAQRILELAYARLPADITNTPEKLVAALGRKRYNEGIREVPDSRLLELAALVSFSALP